MAGRARLTAAHFAHEQRRSGVRYVIVGLSGYLLSVGVFAALLAAGASPYLAVPPGFAANFAWNFTLNRLWTFAGGTSSWGRDLSRFSVVGLATLIANYAVLALLHDVLGLPPVAAQALAILAIVPLGYAGQRFWAFAAR